MKKVLSLILVLTMVLFAFVGCTKAEQPKVEEPKVEEPKVEEPKVDENTVEEPLAEGAVKTGLAVVTSVAKSKDATADAEGVGQSESVVVAVMVDGEGKIVKAAIDTAQTKINFSNEGKVTSDLEATFAGKQELKEKYGMSKASKIGKEWYEQANALADYVVGKTAEEVKAIPTDESGVPTDADLVSSVTVKINGYKEAVEKAVANAQNLGATAEDKLGLGIVTTIAKSKDATADAEGQTQAYSTYTVTTFDAEDKITSNIVDATQATVKFDSTGKITSDLTVPVKTKHELGDEYGMKKASPIGKEWFEQANAFSNYVVTKTTDDVLRFTTDDTGHNTEADLISSVTMVIDNFQLAIGKAFSTAK